jgi:hypothetical protein
VVKVSRDDGWDVVVLVEGRIAALEHHTDWHRIEGCRRRLAAQFGIERADAT